MTTQASIYWIFHLWLFRFAILMALVHKRRENSEACKPLCIKQFIMQSVLVVCVLSLAALASLANGNYFYFVLFQSLKFKFNFKVAFILKSCNRKDNIISLFWSKSRLSHTNISGLTYGLTYVVTRIESRLPLSLWVKLILWWVSFLTTKFEKMWWSALGA